jgi:hypothetical protein
MSDVYALAHLRQWAETLLQVNDEGSMPLSMDETIKLKSIVAAPKRADEEYLLSFEERLSDLMDGEPDPEVVKALEDIFDRHPELEEQVRALLERGDKGGLDG